MSGQFFSFDGEGQEPQVKLGCGHFGLKSAAVPFRDKPICAKCAKLLMKDGKSQGGAEPMKQGGEVPKSPPAAIQGDAEGQGDAQKPAEGQAKDGDGEGKGSPPPPSDGDDSPVMHSELPAILAPINKAIKGHDQAIKTLGQRMDGGQKEIELAKAAFDSHEVRIGKLEEGGDLKARLEALEKLKPQVIKVYKSQDDKSPEKIEGLNHAMFGLLLQTCSARLPDGNRMNVWLRGPAGSGKTTAAANVAKALGLQFAFNGALDSEYKLKGFIDATGKCVMTPFRKVWTEGGVYLFDEIDASLPSAVLSFNAALANANCDFPDANIPRHKDCIVIAAANTFGGGATADYVGRAKQDAAFLDRFVQLDWSIDEALETALTANDKWSSYVQNARKRVAERGLKGIIISPRASLFGASMLASGVPAKSVIEMAIYKGMTPDQRKTLDLPRYIA